MICGGLEWSSGLGPFGLERSFRTAQPAVPTALGDLDGICLAVFWGLAALPHPSLQGASTMPILLEGFTVSTMPVGRSRGLRSTTSVFWWTLQYLPCPSLQGASTASASPAFWEALPCVFPGVSRHLPRPCARGTCGFAMPAFPEGSTGSAMPIFQRLVAPQYPSYRGHPPCPSSKEVS